MTEAAIVELVGKALGVLGAGLGILKGIQVAREKRREARANREAARQALEAQKEQERKDREDLLRSDVDRLHDGFLALHRQGQERDRYYLDLMRRIHWAVKKGQPEVVEQIFAEEILPLREGLYVLAGRPPRGQTYSGRERVARLLRGESVE